MSYERNPIPFNTKFNKITYVIIFTKRIMIEILLYKYRIHNTKEKGKYDKEGERKTKQERQKR